MSSPPCTNVKPPPHKRNASLLTTFWRRFCESYPIFSLVQMQFETNLAVSNGSILLS